MNAPSATRRPARVRRPVSRVEIADHVEAAFNGSWVNRVDLLAEATNTAARAAVLDTLGALPNRPYRFLRDLWSDLAHLPIDNES